MPILIFAIFLILIYCCATDVLYREIKNGSVLLVLICAVSLVGFTHDINVIIPTIILIFGFFLTLIGVIGAGDIKLLFALSISVPSELIGVFLFAMSCFGAPISVLVLLISKFICKIKVNTVPFGIAISIGYIMTMWRFL
ncbi:hypothetical protein EB837_02145 [Kluyvera ascorbata]|uniref:Prepilin type IV endopeptidase peptidase domain-containing protein n=1 Tax=Kluyvera ascorbata TaxID=51288 RepID=A0A3N2SD71_9ENTR|nr:prepilin peptidase [Kluyvera ascorbata]ROU17650.1 hypothetical protein EB837_02145 [Kluyvera ascorbata]